jgi:hypothetical protein
MVRQITVIAFLMAAVVGCRRGGDGVQRVVLTGAVTYKGKPVADGSVLFVPSAATNGPSTAATIQSGKYRLDARGGLPPGTYRVEILGYRAPIAAHNQKGPTPRVGPSGHHATAPQQYLPEKYNVKTQLATKVEASAGAVTRDFTLTE